MRFNEAANVAQKHSFQQKEISKQKEAWTELTFENSRTGIYISDKAEVSASNFPIDTLSNEWGIVE